MKKALLIVTALTSVIFANQNPQDLFEAKCSSCHLKTRPADVSKLVAPPMMGVMRHVKMTYKTKDEAIRFITDYVINPSREKAVCMPGKIKRFGLMPSQKGKISDEELKSIANWLYDNFPPQGFQKFQGQNCKGMKPQK